MTQPQPVTSDPQPVLYHLPRGRIYRTIIIVIVVAVIAVLAVDAVNAGVLRIVDLATLFGFGIPLVLGSIGGNEALRQNRDRNIQMRAEFFFALRRRLKENHEFEKIGRLCENDDFELQKIPYLDKRAYLGLLEEVAITKNSKLIREEVAHYMFGKYVIKCWNSQNFWKTSIEGEPPLVQDEGYWKEFKRFAERLEQIEESDAFKKHQPSYYRELRF